MDGKGMHKHHMPRLIETVHLLPYEDIRATTTWPKHNSYAMTLRGWQPSTNDIWADELVPEEHRGAIEPYFAPWSVKRGGRCVVRAHSTLAHRTAS